MIGINNEILFGLETKRGISNVKYHKYGFQTYAKLEV